MRQVATLLFLYPLAGGVTGFLVAGFAVWPGEVSDTFPFLPVKTDLSVMYGKDIGLPVGALLGFLYGAGMYWFLKPLRHSIIVVTLFSSVSVVGIAGAFASPVSGIQGALLGLLIGTTFLLAIKPHSAGTLWVRDKEIQESSIYRRWLEDPDGQQCVRSIWKRAFFVLGVICVVYLLPIFLFGISSSPEEGYSSVQLWAANQSDPEAMPLSAIVGFCFFLAVRVLWIREKHLAMLQLPSSHATADTETPNPCVEKRIGFSASMAGLVRAAMQDWKVLTLNLVLFSLYIALYKPVQHFVEVDEFVLSAYVKIVPAFLWMGWAVYFGIQLEKLRRFQSWLHA